MIKSSGITRTWRMEVLVRAYSMRVVSQRICREGMCHIKEECRDRCVLVVMGV